MPKFKHTFIFSIFIVINTILSINQWSTMPIGNTAIAWTVNTVIILFLISPIWKQRNILFNSRYIISSLFIMWALIGSIRGYFVAENYWEQKQLVEGIFALSLPLFVYTFNDSYTNMRVLKTWNKWMIPLFFVFFVWVLEVGTYHFLIWPIFFYGIFSKYLPFRWKLFVLIVFFTMMSAGISDRAQAIKVVATIGLATLFYFKSYLTQKLIHLVHWAFYAGTIALLYLGITGQYNIFEDMESNRGEFTEQRVDDEGYTVIEDASYDTRTFIYQEIIESAIYNDYIWTGRTPARGNDSSFFGKHIAEDLGTNKYERHRNEVCHPNVFTWLGLIGMLLYSIIYLQASFLALYRSKSYAMKVLACFVAFHWALGWIEDINRFDVTNIFMWMCIAMCLSEEFRNMDDYQFKDWFYHLFHKRKKTPSLNNITK